MMSSVAWIRVEDSLPQHCQRVLVVRGGVISVMTRNEAEQLWIDDQMRFYATVTHWAPLPEPPVVLSPLEGLEEKGE